MSKYRVYGDKLHKYYIDVEAESQEQAWDLAEKPNSVWFELESDSTIDPFAVEEVTNLE